MYDLPNVLDDLTHEIGKTVKELSKCSDIDEKKKLADIIKTLSEAMGIFLDSMGMITPPYMEDFLDTEEPEIFPDDIVDFNSIKKKKRKKKRDSEDLPF